MPLQLNTLLLIPPLLLLLLLQTTYITAEDGYHYERPTAAANTAYGTHKFVALPALPPLATPRSSLANNFVQVQATSRPAYVSSYKPIINNKNQLFSNYAYNRPASIASAYGSGGGGGGRYIAASAPTTPALINQAIGYAPTASAAASPAQPNIYEQYGIGQTPATAATAATAASAASANDIYLGNGRQLKQYAVYEIIDNDIEQAMQPFLPKPFFDSFRARSSHLIDSFIGSQAFRGVQLQRANTLAAEQQNLAALRANPNDAIALGSGGLGYIRLPNGNIYLGSGSLGYISGQQRVQSLRDARTRTGASMPDALHFGHGPLGGFGFLQF